MHVAAFVSLGARGLFCALALATVVVGASAFAEQPASRCEGSEYAWWELANNIPTILTQVPLRPHIFLPAREPHRFIPEDERYGPDVLEVRVTDVEGNVIAGSVAPADPYRRYDELERVPFWRPDEDLQPGIRYTLMLTVFDSPPNWVEDYPNCSSRRGFSRTVLFTVAAVPPEPPVLSLSVALVGRKSVQESFGSCGHQDVRCAGSSVVCCQRKIVSAWERRVEVDVRGDLPHPLYTVVDFDYEAILPGVGVGSSAQYPFILRTFAETFRDPGEGTPIEGGGCVTATVRSLMSEGAASRLVSVRACPDGYTQDPEPKDMSGPCDPVQCRQWDPSIEPPSASSGCEGGAGGFVGLGWLLWVLRRRGS